jgi:hypothetical protein
MPLCVAGLLNPSACMRMPLCAYIWHRAYECDRQVRTIKLKKLRKGNQPRKKPRMTQTKAARRIYDFSLDGRSPLSFCPSHT